MKSQNPDLLAELKAGEIGGKLPDVKTRDLLDIQRAIEEINDLAEEIGYYKQLLKNPQVWEKSKEIAKNLIELKQSEYWHLNAELEKLHYERKTEKVPF